jgi:hypothetical protein
VLAVAELSDGLQKRLRAAEIGPSGLPGRGLDSWAVWLRACCGRRATLVDLYELEVARRSDRELTG